MDTKKTNRQYAALPYQNLRIATMGNGFQITDDKGRSYKFNGVCETTGTSSPLGWKATSIVSANKKDSVTFSYFSNLEYSKFCQDCIVVIDDFSDHNGLYTDRDYFRGHFQADYNKDKVELMCPLRDYWMQDPVIYGTTYNGCNNFCDIYTYQSTDNGNLYRDWAYQNYLQTEYPKTNTYKLSQILFPSGKVVMRHSHKKDIDGETLDEIDIYNNSGDLVRCIKFEYVLKPAQQRCYLNSVEITGEQGKQFEKYDFEYYNINNLPALGNKSIDYWGYYNGVRRSDTTTLVPYQTIETTRTHRQNNSQGYWTGTYVTNNDFELHIGSPLSRESSEEHMMYGTLKSITYPTSSKDIFEYEAHRYQDPSIGTRLVGGLRIKSITTQANGTPLKIRSFRYGQEENGLGYSPMSSNLEHFMYEQTKQYIEPVTCVYQSGKAEEVIGNISNQVISARHRTFFSNPIKANTFNGGSSVMYEYVTEYDGTPEKNTGKTIYHYNINTDSLSAPVFTMARNNRKDYWNYGQLLDKNTYKNVKGNYILVESTSNEYETKVDNFGTSKVMEAFLTNVIEGDESLRNVLVQASTVTLTDINVGTKVLTRTTERQYDESGNMSQNRKDYLYNDVAPLLLRSRQDTRSGSNTIRTTYKYPTDFTDNVYNDMSAANMYPIVQTEYTSADKYQLIKMPYTQLESRSFLPRGKEYSYASASIPNERISYKYNKYGNKIEEAKDDKEYVTYLYGYNHQEIVAIIENATYADVSSILGTSTIENIENSTDMNMWTDTFEQLRKSLPKARVFSYIYKPLVGVTAITTPDGQTTFFEYDELGRLNKSYQIHGESKEVLKNYQYKYKTEE